MQSLKTTRQFSYVYKKGVKKHSAFFVMHCLRLDQHGVFFNHPPTSLLGLSVSKKVGNAVCRNLIKRRVRAILRHAPIKKQAIVFVAKVGIDTLSYPELKEQILACLAKPLKPKKKHGSFSPT
ncbi:ribonuclease P protein component [Helicobacter bizzozeronii]|uniref:ribonuclease P protein component n=1 Tax=Helicobacter bizzozeronii TaxID=56877 RepID=UPI000CF0A10D|nr:ribonuclease P protein component [Helicobacter bizzozeronii]